MEMEIKQILLVPKIHQIYCFIIEDSSFKQEKAVR